MDLDDPNCTELRKQLLSENRFLYRIYESWYDCHARALPELSSKGKVLEIGSGAGFFRNYMDRESVVTSDIFPLQDVDLTLDAQELDSEFGRGDLQGIAMINVLHHVPDVKRFFSAANATLEPGGVISMVEPWVTTWSRWVYAKLHHEPFDPDRPDWGFETSGPLSGANGALPWIVFERDRREFESAYPDLEIVSVKPMMPLVYLISGGISMRQLQPGLLFGFWSAIEKLLSPWRHNLAMFAHIVVRKRAEGRNQ